MLDSILAEHVLDITFRGELERSKGFCRRHLREMIDADRGETGGILGSSILYAAMLERRLVPLRGVVGARGRGLRTRLAAARKRPPCVACGQGASAVETALGRLVERAADPAWADVTADAPFCLDDLVLLWSAAGDAPSFAPVAARQLARVEEVRVRLEGFIDHSAHDRRHLLTDPERIAARDAAVLLGGAGPGPVDPRP